MVSLPAATPASLTPCSKPHIHHGRDPRTPTVGPRAGSTATWVARTGPSSRRGGCHSSHCASPGGRSEFLAHSVCPAAVAGARATRQSHTGADGTARPPRVAAVPRPVAVVPHTHWDREWYAPFPAFRQQLVELLDGLLPSLEADPSCRHFLLDGQMAMVDDYLAVRPEAASALRRLNGAGRISLGPWYVLMDEFLVSGETIVRNLQLGLERAAALGGSMDVGYLPDMFGHVAQVPQLLRLAGIEHAVVWRGVPAAVEGTAFRWTALDGSSVRAEYLATGYHNGMGMPPEPDVLLTRIRRYVDELGPRLDGGPLLWMNGSDHTVPEPWIGRVVAEADARAGDLDLRVTSLLDHLAAAPPATTEVRGELRSGARANLLAGTTSN